MTSLHGDTEGQVSLPCYLPFDIVFFELWHVAVLCALPVVDDASWRQLCWCTSQFDWDQSFEFSQRWPKSVQKSKEVHRSVKESKEVLKSVDFQKYLGEALFYNPDSRFHIGRQQDLAHYVARPAFCRMGLAQTPFFRDNQHMADLKGARKTVCQSELKRSTTSVVQQYCGVGKMELIKDWWHGAKVDGSFFTGNCFHHNDPLDCYRDHCQLMYEHYNVERQQLRK